MLASSWLSFSSEPVLLNSAISLPASTVTRSRIAPAALAPPGQAKLALRLRLAPAAPCAGVPAWVRLAMTVPVVWFNTSTRSVQPRVGATVPALVVVQATVTRSPLFQSPAGVMLRLLAARLT